MLHHMHSRSLILLATPLLAAAQTISYLPPKVLASGGAVVVSDCTSCVATADFNGDGKPDIAFNIQQPVPQGGVLLGNGDGTFRPVLSFPSPEIGSILVGDFNGDGKSDLAVAGSSSSTIFLGKGDGALGNPVNVSVCAGTTANVSIQAADFNRDGRTDILCGNSVLLSNGDGTFKDSGTVGTIVAESVQLVADFNGDGVPDVLLRRLSGNLSVVLGRGDGTFAGELLLNYTLHPQTSWIFLAADFNADGKIDLLDFSLRGDHIDFLPGNGDGTFSAVIQTDISAGPPPAALTAVGDFNQDGKPDFIAGDSIYAGNGDGTFRFPVFFAPTAAPCGQASSTIFLPSCDYSHDSTVVADFNSDGLPDLVTYTVNKPGTGQIKDIGEVDILLNDSPGNTFTAAGVSAITSTWPVATGSIVSAWGVNLAPTIAVGATNPAPTTLGGIRLHVRDRSHVGDTLAPLLYVSPTQINYLLNSSDSFAWVDIERIGTPYTPQGMTVPVTPIAPALFPIAWTTNAPGYLSLYGTGFAQAVASESSCTIGSVDAQIAYVGPEIQIAGLDQVNLLLPKSLAGFGVQPLYCLFQTAQHVYGITNTVNVTIR
jgi:uncharacterized protein (TIGR03437 family)